MQRYRLELILVAVFLALFLAYCLWISPGSKLTREEVAAYVAKIKQGLTMPEPDRSEFIARVRTWGEADDGGPVYLANIFRLKDPIEPWPGHDIKSASTEATHQVYLDAVKPLIAPQGVWPVPARFVLPDLRLALGTLLLVVFLAVGWVHAARRGN